VRNGIRLQRAIGIPVLIWSPALQCLDFVHDPITDRPGVRLHDTWTHQLAEHFLRRFQPSLRLGTTLRNALTVRWVIASRPRDAGIVRRRTDPRAAVAHLPEPRAAVINDGRQRYPPRVRTLLCP
jgi:hypothetical protein